MECVAIYKNEIEGIEFQVVSKKSLRKVLGSRGGDPSCLSRSGTQSHRLAFCRRRSSLCIPVVAGSRCKVSGTTSATVHALDGLD
ncbi:hypothetical protein SDJN03_23146, partial [Cucurbita argyrosperma subsp. sororia]